MKLKTTKKAIKESGYMVLRIGYCDAQYLLRYQPEFAYSTRREGWACDYYQIGNVIISTGYAPIGKAVDYNLIREYDEKARVICCDYSLKWEDQKEAVNALLYEFIGKATV